MGQSARLSNCCVLIILRNVWNCTCSKFQLHNTTLVLWMWSTLESACVAYKMSTQLACWCNVEDFKLTCCQDTDDPTTQSQTDRQTWLVRMLKTFSWAAGRPVVANMWSCDRDQLTRRPPSECACLLSSGQLYISHNYKSLLWPIYALLQAPV